MGNFLPGGTEKHCHMSTNINVTSSLLSQAIMFLYKEDKVLYIFVLLEVVESGWKNVLLLLQ